MEERVSFLLQASTPEDATDGIKFMQDMIQIAKTRTQDQGTYNCCINFVNDLRILSAISLIIFCLMTHLIKHSNPLQ